MNEERLLLSLKMVNIHCQKNMCQTSTVLMKMKWMHQSFCLKTRIKRGKQKMKILIQESTSCLKKKAKEKKTKSRRQKHAVDNFNTTTAEKEKSIENELFKRYFNYSTPSMMYNALSDTRNTERKFNQI